MLVLLLVEASMQPYLQALFWCFHNVPIHVQKYNYLFLFLKRDIQNNSEIPFYQYMVMKMKC